ncbi:MAG TPA: hypothetical protein VFC79_13695 [Tissierellaceae bacterium]|nr:hypothetical protein [Tissierellaceae bacterium]
MGFQSGVNQAIGTIGAMASVKKVVEGQQEGIAKQEESNKIAKENTEQLEQQNTLLAIDEADKINEEYLQNEEAYNASEKELNTIGNSITETANKMNKTRSKVWQEKYQKAIDEMNNRMESISNTRVQLENRQKALKDRANIINKQTGGKLKDYLFLGTAKEWEERYDKE